MTEKFRKNKSWFDQRESIGKDGHSRLWFVSSRSNCAKSIAKSFGDDKQHDFQFFTIDLSERTYHGNFWIVRNEKDEKALVQAVTREECQIVLSLLVNNGLLENDWTVVEESHFIELFRAHPLKGGHDFEGFGELTSSLIIERYHKPLPDKIPSFTLNKDEQDDKREGIHLWPYLDVLVHRGNYLRELYTSKVYEKYIEIPESWEKLINK